MTCDCKMKWLVVISANLLIRLVIQSRAQYRLHIPLLSERTLVQSQGNTNPFGVNKSNNLSNQICEATWHALVNK